MKKIKTLCNWLEETNPTNYKNYISAPPDITSPDQIEELGWEPKINLQKGIELTYDWFKGTI